MVRFTTAETNKVLAEATSLGRFKTEKERDVLRKAGGQLRKYSTRAGASASAWMLKKRIGKTLVAGGAVSRTKFNKVFRRNLKEKLADASDPGADASLEQRNRLAEKKEQKETEEENKRVKFRKMYGQRIAIDENIKAYMLEKAADDQKRMKEETAKKKAVSSSSFNTPEAEKAIDTVFMD